MSATGKILTQGDAQKANLSDGAIAEQSAIAKRSAIATAIHAVRLLLIAMWLGAALFFSAAVAPSAFAVLATSRELAGAIVSRTLSTVNISGFVIGVLLLLSAPLFYAKRKAARRAEMIALAVVALATGAGQWIIRARLEQLRVLMKVPVDAVAANDPLRIAFGQWHVYSVMALGIGLLAALIAFVLMWRSEDKFKKRDGENV